MDDKIIRMWGPDTLKYSLFTWNKAYCLRLKAVYFAYAKL